MVVRERIFLINVSSDPCFRHLSFAQMVETDPLPDLQQFLQTVHLLGSANIQSAEENAQVNRIRSSTFRDFHRDLAEVEHEQRNIGQDSRFHSVVACQSSRTKMFLLVLLSRVQLSTAHQCRREYLPE